MLFRFLSCLRPALSLPRHPLLLAAAAAAALPSSLTPDAAHAQEGAITLSPVTVEGTGGGAPVTEGFVAEDTVAGTKTQTPRIETPEATSVVTEDQMRAQQAQTVGQALRYTSGVTVEPYGNDPRLDWFSIRGFDATGFGVFLNGLRYTPGYTGATFEPYGLERIDVLKGPASVLYGQGTPGGLVDLISKRPTDTPFHEATLLGGSYGRIQGEADMGGPAGTDGTLSYRLTALARDSGTQTDKVPDDRLFVAPAVTWKPTADDTLTLLTDYQKDHTAGVQFLPAEGTVYASPFGRISRSLFTGEDGLNHYDRQQVNLGYEYEHRFNDTWSVDQNFRYTHFDIDWAQVYGIGLAADGRTMSRYAFTDKEHSDIFAVDNRATARLQTGPVRHTVLLGIDYSHVNHEQDENGALASALDLYDPVHAASLPALSPLIATTQASDQLGLYTQDQMRWGPWALTGNVRQDLLMEQTDNRLAGTTSDQTNHALTGRAGLAYVSGLRLTPFVSYATSFQPTYGTTFDGAAFKPITARQYEAGLKYQLPDALPGFVTTSVFEITEDNALTADPDHTNFNIQTGQVRVRGAEIEMTLQPLPGTDVIASYTHLDPRITRSTEGTKGNRPGGVPSDQASLWGDHRIALGSEQSIGFGGGVRYIGDRAGDDANSFSLPGVTLFDAELSYEIGRYRLAVNAANLLDRTYVASCSSASACFYGAGRTVIGSLRVLW